MTDLSHPVPTNEPSRLQSLLEYQILDTLPEQVYDDFTRLASLICQTPIALITLLDEHRQWFKAKVGLGTQGTPRSEAFCAHAIMEPGHVMVVRDATADARFRTNPSVIGDPLIRFYAGAPLLTRGGEALGTICVIDRKPRDLAPDQLEALKILSREIMIHLELRRSMAALEEHMLAQEKYVDRLQEYQAELERVRSDFEMQSLTDPLTGLGNRRAFDARLEDEFSRARRYQADCALVMVDVDYFKEYNDTFGHLAGDEVLKTIAALLKSGTRTYDLVARYGGEEFAIILPNTDFKGAMVMGERFRRSVQATSWPLRPMTISVGVACIQDDLHKAMDLLQASDSALYCAKRAGRNCVRSLTPQ